MKKTIFLLALVLLVKYSSSKCSSTDCIGYDKSVASYAVQFATCANLLNNFVDQIEQWSYRPCILAQSKESVADISVIVEEQKYLLAYTAYDKKRNLVILSFRATVCGNNYSNAKLDGSFIPKNYVNTQIGGSCQRKIIPSKNRCNAHSGFYNGYQSIKEKVRTNTFALLKKYQALNPRLLITGISLGAALASFATLDLVTYFNFINQKVIILPYTFGQPRIGNEKFIHEFDSAITIFRIVHRSDPVPHMPPRQIGEYNYYNPGIEVFYESNSDLQPDVCAGDSSSCSLNKYQSFELCDHLAYPSILFSQTKVCQVKVCQPNFIIAKNQAVKQLAQVGAFLTKSAKILSGGNLPLCLANYPPQLKCEKKPEANALFENVASFISPQLLQQSSNKSQQQRGQLCTSWICDRKNVEKQFGTPENEEEQQL